ncbi:MAG: hypothetical protein R3F17_05690 [Planctomycetota bacterium]
MSPVAGFLGFLILTVLVLVGVAWTGMRAKRGLHLTLVAAAVASLAMAIRFALKVGQHFDLEAAGAITPVHMAMARIATASYLLPLASGIATLRNSRFRPLHRRLAWLVFGLTLLATVTGAAMLLLAEPIPEA